MSAEKYQNEALNKTDVSKSAFSLSLDNLENEEWIDAFGFDGIYQVSNYGRVKKADYIKRKLSTKTTS